MSTTSRQIVLAVGLVGLLADAVASHPVFAVSKVTLFKVVTADTEVVIGLTRKELDRMEGKTPDAVTKALNSNGKLDVWQYGVRRGGSGELEQTPLRKIVVAANRDVRVESYPTPLKVLPVTD